MNEFDKQNYEVWKWGIFYYNKKDPDLIVPKQNGLGWTFNFAHKISFVVLGSMLAAVIFSVLIGLGVIQL